MHDCRTNRKRERSLKKKKIHHHAVDKHTTHTRGAAVQIRLRLGAPPECSRQPAITVVVQHAAQRHRAPPVPLDEGASRWLGRARATEYYNTTYDDDVSEGGGGDGEEAE